MSSFYFLSSTCIEGTNIQLDMYGIKAQFKFEFIKDSLWVLKQETHPHCLVLVDSRN